MYKRQEATFIADLASCAGVVAGGGFTLMGEAVYPVSYTHLTLPKSDLG